MASETYTLDVFVLKKTKLGESDLILTCLTSEGDKVQMVAKGARKPGNTFASRLELMSFSHVLLVKGRSLDVVKEAKLIEGNGSVRDVLEKSVAAGPMLEVLSKISVDGVEDPRFYRMTEKSFGALRGNDASLAPVICCAHVLKAFAFGGLTPSFGHCCSCGSSLSWHQGSRVHFSYHDGGLVCPTCLSRTESVLISGDAISCAQALLRTTFAELPLKVWGLNEIYQVLSMCQMWSRVHVGSALKSLDFMMTFALPE